MKDWFNASNKVLVASDHGGLQIKNFISDILNSNGYQSVDLGPYLIDPDDDYPDYAGKLCRVLLNEEYKAGILVCRSGAGMLINANRFHGIRAVLGFDVKYARQTRDHNCSNVLVIPGDFISKEKTEEIVLAWLNSTFSNEERHIRRLKKIENNSNFA